MNSKVVKFEGQAGADAKANIPADCPLNEQVILALQTVYDPEIPLNIYDLGLIYNIDINDSNDVEVQMTLTAPGCPMAAHIVQQAEQAIAALESVGKVSVELVWEPAWTQDRMSEAAKLELGLL